MAHSAISGGRQVGAGLPDGNVLPDWYEAGLPLLERKRRGHYSTPLALVERMLDACGYTPDADLSHLRVLDPACGSGNFLAAAARRLLASVAGMGYSRKEQERLLACNLWGFDPDPVACFLSRMQGLVHIHQADSLALHWEPCVDLFLTNPPYLAAKNTDLSGYRSALQRGQADSYLLFLVLAMQAVRPGGWIGLVLPDPVLARLNAARERRQLLRQMTLHELWHLSDVFEAEVGAVVLIAQNVPPAPQHQVAWERSRWQASSSLVPAKASERQKTGRVAQELLLRQPAAEMRYLLSNEHGMLFEQLRRGLEEAQDGERRLAPLGEFVTISRGEELGRDSPFIRRRSYHRENSASISYPVLRGGIDVRPYVPPRAQWRIDHEAVTKPLERYRAPKLLVVKSTDRLQATLDTRGHVALQTLYLLHMRAVGAQCIAPSSPGESVWQVGAMHCAPTGKLGGWEKQVDWLYFFQALLNSRLLREYVLVLHTAYKWVQPQIEQRVLAALPVPLVGEEARSLVIEQAKAMEQACSKAGAVVEWNAEIMALYETLESTIRALYIAACKEVRRCD
jgi:SAM-dependent methyltransferase